MIMDIFRSFIVIIIFFHEAFKYGDGAKFWGYVGTNAEFSDFVYCRNFVSYLTY
jgi:hypothetical protein